jgi:SpoVK/Ycf46/Vps4 family AAA+-type ATPase
LLGSIFINPLVELTSPSSGDPDKPLIDPDKPLIDDKFARSAILFGPPGTGKTTLVSGVADAIGWKYIELHPSHFVSEGLSKVQRTADLIFSELMEVDHAVILFDEIDELVRERDLEPDQFGRFLTTSMLPRLAELWAARKVMYFIATNHIDYFDRAVTRSGRFDAIIFLSPPSFQAKKVEIEKILQEDYSIQAKFGDKLTEQSITAAMPTPDCVNARKLNKDQRVEALADPLPSRNTLSKFALVRWDELHDIALHLSRLLKDTHVITLKKLKAALDQVSDKKSRNLGEYCRFVDDRVNYERFDSSRKGVWVVTEIDEIDVQSDPLPQRITRSEKHLLVRAALGSMDNISVSGFTAIRSEPSEGDHVLGTVRLRKNGAPPAAVTAPSPSRPARSQKKAATGLTSGTSRK